MLSGDASTQRIIEMAIDVHRHLGPDLFEPVCEECLCLQLEQAGIVQLQRLDLSRFPASVVPAKGL